MSRRFANSLKRVKPSLQARIDYSHLAAPDLMCCLFNERAGPVRNLCTWRQADATTGTAPTWDGIGLSYGGAGYTSFGDVTWFDGLSAFTVAIKIASVTLQSPATAGGLLNKRGGGSSNNAFSIFLQNPAGTPTLAASIGTGSAEANLYQWEVSGNVPRLWFLTYNSSRGALERWYALENLTSLVLNTGLTTDGNGAVPNTTTPLILGAVNSNSPLYATVQFEYLYAWSGARGPDLRDTLLDDPYCFLDDGPRRVYFVPASVVAHEISARPLARATVIARATVVRGAAARFLADSRAAASSTVVRSAQARAVSSSRVAAYAGVVRGASVKVAGVATVSARLAAVRLMSARVNGRSVMLVGEARKAGLKLTIGDTVKVRLAIGDELAEG